MRRTGRIFPGGEVSPDRGQPLGCLQPDGCNGGMRVLRLQAEHGEDLRWWGGSGGHVCDGAGREGSGQTLRGQSGRPGEEGRMWPGLVLWPSLCLLSLTPHSLGWVPAKPHAPQTRPSSGMRACALSALPSLPMTPSPSSTYCWVQRE